LPSLRPVRRVAELGSLGLTTLVTPIDTYSEVRFDGKRSFQLFADRVVVRGSVTLTSDFDTSIPLASLQVEPTRLHIRHRVFVGGLWIATVSSILVAILVGGFHFSFLDWPVWLPAGFGVMGLLFMAATVRKVEFVQFKSNAGVTVLDIARSGKDASRFDSFIETLRSQIKKAKSET